MREEYKYFYYIPQIEGIEDAKEIFSIFTESWLDEICKEAAENEWDNHDGSEWMSDGVDELVVLRENGTEVGRCKIMFEAQPVFYSVEVDDDDEE